ncbi:DUF6266 family protein [Pedobacter heparinus]|uniref:DUF6266 family protein n=1 Tax=Pedobacter heparinus TaxID=984 RepID=UPI00292CC9D4|nr:DUF6266 family protein [Pedobacter heparinus]
MARLLKGIFGPISGKLGPVIGSSWKGIAYLREVRPKKETKVPRTEAQIANEQKFKFVQNWLVPFHPYVTIGFSKKAIRKSEINVAFSANFHLAITGVYPNLDVDYSKVIISAGELPQLDQPAMELVLPDTLKITWQQNTDPGASFDDQLMLVLYCPELKMADGLTGGVKRKALTCSFQFDPLLIGKPLEVYIAVTSSDRKKIADSRYLGRMEP